MPRNAPLQPSAISASSRPSDRLLGILHRQSTLWKTFNLVAGACSRLGAEEQWQQFTKRLLDCFHANGIGHIARGGQDNLTDLITIAKEIGQLVWDTPLPVASTVQTKIVCLLNSPPSPSRSETDRHEPFRMPQILVKGLTRQLRPTCNGKGNKLVELSQVQSVLPCTFHIFQVPSSDTYRIVHTGQL